MNISRFFLTLILLLNALLAGNPVSVPINHEVYPFLDRMESLGIIGNLLDGVKPLDRNYVSQVLSVVNEQRGELTNIDQQRLDNLLADFRYENNWREKYIHVEQDKNWYTPFSSFNRIKKDFVRFFKQNHPEEENHIFLWEDATNSFYFDFIMDFTYDRRSDKLSRSSNRQSYRMRGTIAENFGYALEVQLIAVRGDEEYRDSHPILKDTWNQTSGGKIFFDRSGGELAYHSQYADFRFAHQPLKWGVGNSGLLIL